MRQALDAARSPERVDPTDGSSSTVPRTTHVCQPAFGCQLSRAAGVPGIGRKTENPQWINGRRSISDGRRPSCSLSPDAQRYPDPGHGLASIGLILSDDTELAEQLLQTYEQTVALLQDQRDRMAAELEQQGVEKAELGFWDKWLAGGTAGTA